jgi:Domain of unknown function (DUF4288)
MAYDKKLSPVGWYVGSYLLRFVELSAQDRSDPEKRFSSWENTVLVKATSLEEAYAKVERIAKQNSKPYRGGSEGVRVQWEYLGVTDLLPIYEEIQDGAEIAWAERSPRKLKNLRQLVKTKGFLCK